MATPFGPTTWAHRSALGLPLLNGVYSGLVSGARGASFHKASKVAQVLEASAHHFTTFFNAARISFDEGRTWVDSYRGDQPNGAVQEVVFGVWSLDTPTGVAHYQARWNLQHSFFVADGSLLPGSVDLYVCSDLTGGGFSKLQTLYTWPHIVADPAMSGGGAGFNTFPSITQPILIPGSGPDGEDAFWMAVSFSIHAGGANNPTTIDRNHFWRSLDGYIWEQVRDLTGVLAMSIFKLFYSKTRLIAVGTGMFYTDDQDLLTATFSVAAGFPAPNAGGIEAMYGGTLLTNRNGSLISGGFSVVSCDNGANWIMSTTSPIIGTQKSGHIVKVGPSEAICIVSDDVTNLRSWYSNDGGENFVDEGVWNVSSIGDQAIAAFIKSDGSPLVISFGNCFVSSGKAAGTFQTRTQCPLANAGLVAVDKLALCGNPIQVDSCP